MLSPGQIRLRELVEPTARSIDPAAFWWRADALNHAEPRDRHAGIMLKQLRGRAVSDPVIAGDAITGQQLDRPPVSRTYAKAQRYAGPAETVSSAPIDADAIVNCRGGSPRRELACFGVDKPHTVYGALTWLALERRLPPQGADATLLLGSQVVICGSGSHHRTLACFLWGTGDLAALLRIDVRRRTISWRADRSPRWRSASSPNCSQAPRFCCSVWPGGQLVPTACRDHNN